jgi:acyl carrier protein
MQEIYRLIADQFGLVKVHSDDDLMDDLGGDPLDIIELVMRLEEHYNIQIDDYEADTIKTVQDVCDCVISKVTPAAAMEMG